MSAYPAGYIEQLARPFRARGVEREERAHAHGAPRAERAARSALAHAQLRRAGRLRPAAPPQAAR